MGPDGVPDPVRPLLRELTRAARAAGAPDGFRPELERPRNPEHGDWATNAALVLGGRLEAPPREIAEAIAGRLDRDAAGVDGVDVAGPGFINFRLSDRLVWAEVAAAVREDEAWGRQPDAGDGRVNVEFVSANPTGPLHVAHGRGAALGDAVASLLEWTGRDVTREFYVNDAGRQIELLGRSVDARFRSSRGADTEIPEGGYRGEYVADLAERIAGEEGEERLERMDPGERSELFARRAVEILRAEQERDLEAFGVRMDTYTEESALYDSGAVEDALERLEEAGLTYREEGAVWLRTTDFGDEKDRVLVKSDGEYTYFLPDIAYHVEKARRGFARAIDVWGADHHGHVPRMEAALAALGLPEGFLETLLIQLVSVYRGEREVRMSKRAGDFVTLRQLYRETGPDVARYFFLMRRAEVHLKFDLELALDTSEDNPVYKVQYAHARMFGVFDRGDVDPGSIEADPELLGRLRTESEREVAKLVARFPETVREATDARAPYRVCSYLEELAGAVNAWYHEGNEDPSLRVLADGPQRPARLALSRAVQVTLRNGLLLLGLEAPREMAREGDAEEAA